MRRRLAAALALGFALSAGPALADRVDQLSARVNQDVQSQNNQDGLAAARELEPIVRRRWGTTSMNYAAVMHNQGLFLHNLGQYREAIEKFEAARQIKEHFGDWFSYIRTSNLLASTYEFYGQLDKAQAVAQHALDLAQANFGGDDTRLAGPLIELGTIAQDREHYADAEAYLERAVAIYAKATQPDPNDRADALATLGDAYARDSRFTEAETRLQSAQNVLDTAFGPRATQSPNYDKILDDLANLYFEEGRYADAEKTFKHMIALENAKPPAERFNLAADMGNLGRVYDETSRFAEAEDMFRQTVAIYERVYGPDHPTFAIGLESLANTYLSQGRVADAVGLQQRVIAIREKAEGSTNPDVARALTNLGNSYIKLQRRADAIPLYRRALQIFQAAFGPDSPQSIITLDSLGQTEVEIGDFAAATTDLEASLRITQKTYGADHPKMVQALRSLGHLARDKGDLDGATNYYERALPLAEAKLGAGDYVTLATYLNLADIASRQDKWDVALGLLRRAAKAAEDQGTTANARALGVDAFLVRALRHAADAQPVSPSLIDEAFQAAQRAHETQVGAAVAQMAARFAAGTDAMAGAIRRAQDLRGRVDTLDKLISTELGKPDAQRNEAAIGRLRADYATAKTDLDTANANLTRNFPAYAELSKPAPLSILETQALLRPDEALVAYLVDSSESFVFAISRDKAAWARIPLGNHALNEKVAALRKGLFNDADPTGATTAPFDVQVAHELYTTLLAPVGNVLADRPKLIIVPAGALTSMPFHVLVTKEPDMSLPQQQRLRAAAWLVKDKAIFIQPSVSSLRALRRFAKASRATQPFIGFGDPVLKSAPGATKRNMPMPPYASVYRGPTVDLAVLRNGLPPLPETANELRAVAKALDAPTSDVHLGMAATVADVESAQLSNYKVIDFATHGLVGGEVGGLSEPALVLSIPDQPTPDNDGLLTASKVAKLSLDADWAVLSACNTAAGATPGAEGLSGLARAFFYAGARALLVSNWPVDSDAAVSLTTGAFAELKKDPSIGRAEALRRAMLAMIANPSAPDNADPSIWAPFEVVGEGGGS